MKCAGAYLWININDYLDTLSLSEEVASEDKHDAMRTATEVMMASRRLAVGKRRYSKQCVQSGL